jgi:hypothetical protein
MHLGTTSATLGVCATGDRILAPANTGWLVSDVEIGGPRSAYNHWGACTLSKSFEGTRFQPFAWAALAILKFLTLYLSKKPSFEGLPCIQEIF